MKRSTAGLEKNSRGTLQDIVARRMDAERKVVRTSAEREPSPFSQSTDFSTLPGMQELKLQRSAADVIGLTNPYFRVHEARAGATTKIAGQWYTNFSSYDYLGLNGHPEVQAAACAAIGDYGSSCSASRLVAGERPIHRELERAVATHYKQEDAIVFVSGHGTNVTAISALLGQRDLVIHDSLAHNSIVLGATLSGAARRSFPHNDTEALNRILESSRAQYERVLIVVEGLYSMDGDCADLAALVEIKRRHGAWLMVDEAHGLGVLGEKGNGAFELFGIAPTDVDIWMGTLSKTLSSCGGYIAGCQMLVEYLKCMSGGFVYSVGLPPAMAAAALTSLRILHREPERVARLRRNAGLFWTQAKARKLDVGSSEGHAIVPVVVHSSLAAVTLSQTLFERGINVQPIIHPAVPERHARLRFFVSAEHTPDQITATVQAIAGCLGTAGSAVPGFTLTT
jgi:8-amino-7-oxononanoate synthase